MLFHELELVGCSRAFAPTRASLCPTLAHGCSEGDQVSFPQKVKHHRSSDRHGRRQSRQAWLLLFFQPIAHPTAKQKQKRRAKWHRRQQNDNDRHPMFFHPCLRTRRSLPCIDARRLLIKEKTVA